MNPSRLSRLIVPAALCVCTLTVASTGRAAPAAQPACGPPAVDGNHAQRVLRVLSAGRDVWGEALLSSSGGPTYDGARQYLPPLLFAAAPKHRKLTESGVYYVPLGDPPGPAGTVDVALHVADGGQLISRRVGGPSLNVFVGARGTERYGSCLGRLVRARLLDGYLPVLETAYADEQGTEYRQESFATRFAGSDRVASFVHVSVDARRASDDAVVRFTPSSVAVPTSRGASRDIYIAWLHHAGENRVQVLDEAGYAAAREGLVARWERRLSGGMRVSVPERRVEDAERALLVQNLLLGWRYSVGNPYEEFSFPEGPDVAQVLGEHGFPDVERAILEASLARASTGYGSWKRGERLLVSATYFRLFRDGVYLERATPTLAGYVEALGAALRRDGPAILARERYSADIPDSVYGLHAQTVAWAGLRAIASVWAQTGHGRLAGLSRRLASRLEPGLRAAVRASERRLADGSVFLPARLLDREAPYRSLVEERSGSYWNLVTPFALSSGFFRPGSPEARGVLRYMLRHGSRLLGLVRAGAYALYGRTAPFPVSGTDQVYGVNVARFLADNDRPDQLVLSLYGQLAAAMTPGTFVAGEAASVAPLHGRRDRTMYLPPNSASNAAFLETLRLMLVHETVDADGRPHGLELAYATPRAWLRSGGQISVSDAPTSFGPVSFAISVSSGSIRVRVAVPHRATPARVTLRLRLPGGYRVSRVDPARPFDAATSTIDLSGARGSLQLDVRVAKRGG